MKKTLASLMLLIGTITSPMTSAEPQANIDFAPTTQTIPTDNPSKIEVIEIFWYGCPHCYHMEPLMMPWLKKQSADVYFKRVPGIARPDWAVMAKAYYALESLGLLDKLHGSLFEAIHKQKVLRPNDEAAAIDWIAKQAGLDHKKVEEAFNSFSASTKLNRAMQIFQASGATGVPALIIDGRYITAGSMAGGNEAALKVADYLIENVRKEKSAAKK